MKKRFIAVLAAVCLVAVPVTVGAKDGSNVTKAMVKNIVERIRSASDDAENCPVRCCYGKPLQSEEQEETASDEADYYVVYVNMQISFSGELVPIKSTTLFENDGTLIDMKFDEDYQDYVEGKETEDFDKYMVWACADAFSAKILDSWGAWTDYTGFIDGEEYDKLDYEDVLSGGYEKKEISNSGAEKKDEYSQGYENRKKLVDYIIKNGGDNKQISVEEATGGKLIQYIEEDNQLWLTDVIFGSNNITSYTLILPINDAHNSMAMVVHSNDNDRKSYSATIDINTEECDMANGQEVTFTSIGKDVNEESMKDSLMFMTYIVFNIFDDYFEEIGVDVEMNSLGFSSFSE